MTRGRRLGFATVAVLRSVVEGFRYGFDIMDATGLPGGTVYPALARLEDLGHLRSAWEAPEAARSEKRPARRYYAVTRSGERALRDALDQIRAMTEPEPSTSDAEARADDLFPAEA